MKIKKKFKFKKRYIALVVIVILVITAVAGGQKARRDAKEFHEVSRADISEQVTLAGDIDIEDRADLGFGFSGRVASVLVEEGQAVEAGDFIAQLSMNQLQAELLEAQANLQQARASQGSTSVDLSFAFENLQNTVEEQDVSVQTAYRALLNNDLQAYTEDNTSATPPVISGTYTGTTEGEYIISMYNSNAPSGYSFTISGLEDGFASARTNSPGVLGEQGLFIQFDAASRYENTEWVIPIPNTRSSTYTTNKNAYDQAVATRLRTISQVEDDYAALEAEESQGSSLAGVSAAEARVEAVRAQMRDGVIRAPFDGIVGKIDLVEGEVVSGNTAYVTIVGDTRFELELDVPEIDVAKISTGDMIDITLDAYGDSVVWQGAINSIDVIDTIVDGVPVYETRAAIVNPDERIRVGMSAKAEIVTQEKQSVLTAPKYFFTRTSEGYEAIVLRGEDEETVLVELGIEGNDGMVEIVSGLQAGDTLVYNRPIER
jgi:HlyD family secretion protein